MRTVKYGMLAALTLGLMGLFGTNLFQAREEKPKYTIKEVMKIAHKDDKLMQKVASGKGEKEDKEKLVELYTALSKSKPPKGDDEEGLKDWKKRTDEMVKAAKAVLDDKKDAGKALAMTVKCMACHELHR